MMTALVTVALAAQPPELGIVGFSRGYEAAAARAKVEGKPLAVLFDEVPGCSTVLGFGHDVLSHPLIADALEHELVAVVVYNNIGADDRRVLELFKEPAWNNPVLRLFTPDGRELARLDTPSLAQVTRALSEALTASGRPVPPYLSLLADETRGGSPHQYAMGCFWEGEASLGKLDGVTSTRTGFVKGREVVEVTYAGDARALDAAAAAKGYSAVSGELRASPDDDKKQLQGTRYRFVPLTPLQKTRINAAVRDGERWLSPRQLELYRRGERDVLDTGDVVEAFRAATR